jgi:hypothetical protein
MEMPQIGEPHNKLARLAGTWVGEEKLYPSPWDPKGGPAVARITNRIALDGFAIVQDYEQERHGKANFKGLAVFTWDSMQKNYILTWWDTMGFPGHEFRGHFEGNTLTYSSKTSEGYMRAKFEFKDDNHYYHLMEVSGDNQIWAPFMEGTYSKK